MDLSNYATKSDLKNATGVDTSKCAKKVDLASLKSNVDKSNIYNLKNVATDLSNLKSKIDKLDIAELAHVPVNLIKLSIIVKLMLLKKTKHKTKIKNIQDKLPDITNLPIKTILNAKINEVKGEIPSITNLATTAALTAVKIKFLMLVIQLRKLTVTQKINEIEKKNY